MVMVFLIVDKELITPTNCQPVDADGVGASCPPSCGTRRIQNVVNSGCIMPSTLNFNSGSNLEGENLGILSAVVAVMKSNPDCRVVVEGHGADNKKLNNVLGIE